MENDYNISLENFDPNYIHDEYMDQSNNYAQNEYQEQTQQNIIQNSGYPQAVHAVYTQPVIQPVYTQPIYTQPVYTQPIIMPAIKPAEQIRRSDIKNNNYFPIEELKPIRWHAHPLLVFFALILCFPIGLILLLFFTKWGVFPKVYITLFTLICSVFVYELVILYSNLDFPSLLGIIF